MHDLIILNFLWVTWGKQTIQIKKIIRKEESWFITEDQGNKQNKNKSIPGYVLLCPEYLSCVNHVMSVFHCQEEFEDTKGVIKIRKLKKNRQHNGQDNFQFYLNNKYDNVVNNAILIPKQLCHQ